LNGGRWKAISLDDGGDPFGFIAQTRDHWEFRDALEYTSDSGKYRYVFCDLAIDSDPLDQQRVHHTIHINAVNAALRNVEPGGTCIVKLFGGMESSFDLGDNATRSFFFKPDASNVLSDEVYWIFTVTGRQYVNQGGIREKWEPTLLKIWEKKMYALTGITGEGHWSVAAERFYVDISGHLGNFLIGSEFFIFDVPRYLQNIEGNLRRGSKSAPRAIDESGSGGLWHSAVEWYLATFVAEELAKMFELDLAIGTLQYTRGRLEELSSRYKRFNERSATMKLEKPNSRVSLTIKELLERGQ
jgi:hypothetical protein